MNERRLLIPFILLLSLLVPLQAAAHGAEIAYTIDMTVTIVATYDNGDPMVGGQVTVYAPDAPETPWLTGKCDENGRFTFTPDPTKPGTWDVQVRQAGHGDIIHISLQDGAIAAGSSAGFTTPQIALLGGSVVWGFIGTALYFSRRKA